MSNESINESLLETIGRLYGRNQSLQRGHATLTRRVQELETKLKQAQKQILETSNGPFAIAGAETFINNALIGSSIISKADTQLQADIEALTTRVMALEDHKPTPVFVDPRALSICRRELFELKARYGYEALHCAFQEISK